MRTVSQVQLAGSVGALLLLSCAWTLASPLSHSNVGGCAAVNEGAFDLAVHIGSTGLQTGLAGSGFVDGFAAGDVLNFTYTAQAGPSTFLHRLSLVAFDPYGSRQISRVFVVGEQVLAPGEHHAAGTRYVIPASAVGWALFTSSLGEGEGDFTIKVRCEPSDVGGTKATS